MFYKKVNKNSNKECFEFLNGHYSYFTMNSWNGLQSIANNVKLHRLDLRNDWTDVLEALEDDQYCSINLAIEDFNSKHNVDIGFNGRSGGYLVLYAKEDRRHIFANQYSPCDYYTYEDWVDDVKEYYGSLKNYHSELMYQVELVQAFDKLCDDLVGICDAVTDEYLKNKGAIKKFSATKQYEEYFYDTAEDQRLHTLFMKNKGYRVYEYETDEDNNSFWTEFQMCEYIEDEVVDR